MMKNLKKLILSIFIFIFSLVNTLNVLTFASAPSPYPYGDFDSAESSDNEENLDEVNDFDENIADYSNIYDRCLKKTNARKNKKFKLKSKGIKQYILNNLYFLCQKLEKDSTKIPHDSLGQYTFVCKNFCKLGAFFGKYIETRRILNGFAVEFLNRNLMDSLILEKYEKIMVDHLYKSALSYFTSKGSEKSEFKILDAIFIYSYILMIKESGQNTEENISDLVIIEEILINNGIDPEKFTPLEQ